MTEHEASRTLVKSPPELWSECSDAGSLARHLGEFGEIKITRLEPETAVAWEGERVSGTVRIEPSGWGTRVTLTAQVAEKAAVPVEPAPPAEPAAEPGPEAAAEPEPAAPPEPEPASNAPPESLGPPPRFGFFARVRELFKPERAVAEVAPPEPAPEPQPPELPAAPEPEPPAAPEPEPPAPEPSPRAPSRAARGARARARLGGIEGPGLGARQSRPGTSPPVLALLIAERGLGAGR